MLTGASDRPRERAAREVRHASWDIAIMPVFCPTAQTLIKCTRTDSAERNPFAPCWHMSPARAHGRTGETSMYYVAAALLVLSGLFYSASHHELGQLGANMCTYGSAFCDSPVIV